MSRLATVVVIIALTTIPALGELCADAKHTTCLQPTGDIVSKGPCRSDSEVLPGANAPYAADNSGAVGGSLSVPLTIPEPAGIARISEPVTVGVPLSREANITDVARLGIFDADTELPAQFRVLSRWDGPPDAVLPIRWVLADFQFDTGAGQLQTVFLRNTGSGNGSSQLSIDVSDPSVAVIDTGSMEVILSRTRGNLFERVSVGGQVVAEDTTAQRDRSGVTLVDGDGTVYRAALTANPEFVVEEQGPMRITIRITSDLTAADGTVLHPGDVQVMHRIHFYANQSFVRMHIQLENNATYGSFDWDNNSPDPDNVLDFDSLVLDVPLQVSGQRFLQADGYQDTGSDSDTWRVYQGHTINDPMDESQNFFYEVSKNGVPVSTGDRYPGWIDISTSNGGTTAGVRWFWQNWEKALSVTGDRLSVELWPAEGFYPPDRMPANLYQFEGGRHKSYEVLLLFHDSAGGEPGTIMGRFEAPLIARAPPRWYYQTQALGLTDPGDLVFSGTDDDARMNVAYQRYNDLMRKRADGIAPDEGREWPRNIIEAKEMRFVYGWYDPCCWSSVDWYGWPHFGDNAWGDGYSSNHYDMPAFLMTHFLRLGDRALWDLAEPHIRQASEWGQVWGIDPNWFVAPISFYEKTNHGLFPERTRPAASHNWLRRLVLYYWLTGNQTAYDAAMFNAEGLRRYFYDAFNILDPASFAFNPKNWSPLTESRFFSWTLENAMEVYAMTGEQRWMDMAEDLVACLRYAYDQVGTIDGPWAHVRGVNLMSHYGSEPLVRFHQSAPPGQARDDAMTILRGMITGTYEMDRVQPWGSGTDYLPAAIVDDWDGGNEGPEDYDTLFNGFAASVYAYVGRLDGNQAYLQTAHRLWADGVFYPEYYSEYTPDPANRMPVDHDNYWTWGWNSGWFPGSNEKVFARQTRAGIPYLWVISQILDQSTIAGDFDGSGNVDLSDYAIFVDCLTGPGATTPPQSCTKQMFTSTDMDGDGDVDLIDSGFFQAAFD